MKSLLSDTSSRIFCLASRVAMAVAFFPLLALPAQLAAQSTPATPSDQAPSSSPPANPDQRVAPSVSCPIRVDEAYLTADPSALPAQAVTAGRTLHVTLVDASGKQIISYVVHAKIDLRPTGTMTNAPQTANVARRWRGTLEPDTPAKQQWSFPSDRFTTGLRRVWFDKVTFADGTMWNKTPNDGCSYAATGRVVQTK